jgi:hypothetical protein
MKPIPERVPSATIDVLDLGSNRYSRYQLAQI